MPYGSSNAELLALAGGDSAKVTEALAAAAAEIDASLAAAGYATPVAYLSTATADQQTQLNARLAYAGRALAAWLLSSGEQGKRGASSKVAKDAEETRKWLGRIAGGQEGFPFITRSGAVAAFGVAGSHTWGIDSDLLDATELLF